LNFRKAGKNKSRKSHGTKPSVKR